MDETWLRWQSLWQAWMRSVRIEEKTHLVIMRGYKEENLIRLKFWSHRKTILILSKDMNLKRKFWVARRLSVRAQTVPSARTRCPAKIRNR
jgi:hypothetical protein